VVVLAVVVAVSVEVCAVVSVIVTEVGERLQVVGLLALEGDEVIAQESETVPVNELDGVTLMAEVLDEPGATVMAPLLLRVKLELPLPPPGACQKFPQPAKSGAAARKSLAHFPILIAAPQLPFARYAALRFRSQG
jgi:hypothetical protein